MNILFVTNLFRMFGDSNCGASNRSTMFVKALAQLGHVDVITFAGEDVSNIPNCEVVFGQELWSTAKKNGRWSKFAELFTPWNPNAIYPLVQEKVVIIEKQLAQKHYDYIACRYINEAASCGLLKYSDRLILDTDDNPIEKAKLEMQQVYSLRNKIYHLFKIGVIAIQTRLILSKVFCVFHSNILQPPCSTSIYLPNLSLNDKSCLILSEKLPMRMLVVGWMDYFPNKDGVSHFIKFIYPIIKQRIPLVELHIVGKLTDSEIRSQWNNVEGVSVMGFIPNIQDEYEQARCVIVPLYHGSGTSVKVIEAMQINRPCICSPMGIRGLDVYFNTNEDFLMGSTDENFADACVQLLSNIQEGNRIATNAKNKAQKYFSQERFINVVRMGVEK